MLVDLNFVNLNTTPKFIDDLKADNPTAFCFGYEKSFCVSIE